MQTLVNIHKHNGQSAHERQPTLSNTGEMNTETTASPHSKQNDKLGRLAAPHAGKDAGPLEPWGRLAHAPHKRAGRATS